MFILSLANSRGKLTLFRVYPFRHEAVDAFDKALRKHRLTAQRVPIEQTAVNGLERMGTLFGGQYTLTLTRVTPPTLTTAP